MFLRKPKLAMCTVCGKSIEAKERRFVDRNRITKVERHVHLVCRNPEALTRQR